MTLRAAPTAATAWWLAARPRTLAVGIGPVAVGTSVAFAHGHFSAGPAIAALLAAMLLQIGSNFANDVYDSEKGVDGEDRLGPPRAVQLGLLSPRQMKRGMLVVLGLAACVGLYLLAVAGWPILALGLVSIAAAVAYTGGPWPLGYHGLGDAAVFLFFGVAAVVGTEFVQSLRFSPAALAASLPVGCLATAVLVVNNLRDIETDRRAGKRTLAVRMGARGSRLEFALLVLTPFALAPAYWLFGSGSPWLLLAWITLPPALTLVRGVLRGAEGARLNPVLGATARLCMHYSLLFAVGYAL